MAEKSTVPARKTLRFPRGDRKNFNRIKLFVYAFFAVDFVIHFMKQRDLFGVEGNPLEKSGALVRACAFFKYFVFKLIAFFVSHTNIMRLKNYFYSPAVNFVTDMPCVSFCNVYARNALYTAEKRVRIHLADIIPVFAEKHVYTAVVKP